MILIVTFHDPLCHFRVRIAVVGVGLGVIAPFRAVGTTWLEVATNPKHLGSRVGFLAVLHTWGQNLMY
jgi:hypothetical protein